MNGITSEIGITNNLISGTLLKRLLKCMQMQFEMWKSFLGIGIPRTAGIQARTKARSNANTKPSSNEHLHGCKNAKIRPRAIAPLFLVSKSVKISDSVGKKRTTIEKAIFGGDNAALIALSTCQVSLKNLARDPPQHVLRNLLVYES